MVSIRRDLVLSTIFSRFQNSLCQVSGVLKYKSLITISIVLNTIIPLVKYDLQKFYDKVFVNSILISFKDHLQIVLNNFSVVSKPLICYLLHF